MSRFNVNKKKFIKLFTLILVLFLILFSLYRYSSYGETYPLSFPNRIPEYRIGPLINQTITTPWVNYPTILFGEINSTNNIRLRILIADQIEYESSGYRLNFSLFVMSNQTVTFIVQNLENDWAILSIEYALDGFPIRVKQMSYAPFFTIFPSILILYLVNIKRKCLNFRFKHRIINCSLIYDLVIFPVLSAIMLIQISMIAHSASGGAFIQLNEFYTTPFSYIIFFLKASQSLFQYLFLISEFLLIVLILGFLLIIFIKNLSIYISILSSKVLDLFQSNSFRHLIWYYYIVGTKISLITMGIIAYGPQKILSILSLSPLLKAVLLIYQEFGIKLPTSLAIAPILMLLGALFAGLLRLWIRVVKFPSITGIFKGLTLISLVMIPLLIMSPLIKEDYYSALSAIGFGAFPFFIFCITLAIFQLIFQKIFQNLRNRKKFTT